MLVAHQPAQPANGDVLLPIVLRRHARAALVPRRIRHARGSARPRPARAPPSPCRRPPGPARCASAGSAWISASVAASTSVSSVCTSNGIGSRQRWQRSCSVPLHFEPQRRPAALVAHAADLVLHLACIRREHVAQPREIAQRPDSLLRCAGRRELEAVDHRLVRHKAADDIIVGKSPSKQSDGSAPATRARVRLDVPAGAPRAPWPALRSASSPDVDETPARRRVAGGHGAAPLGAQGAAPSRSVRRPLIIGSDQVAACGGRRYGKPGNHENAARQLRELSAARPCDFHTAVTLLDTRSRQHESRLVPCRVTFRTLTSSASSPTSTRAALRLRRQREGRRPRHRAHRAHRDRGPDLAHRPAADRAHRDARARRPAASALILYAIPDAAGRLARGVAARRRRSQHDRVA